MFAKSQEKIARLEQIELEKRLGNIKSPIKTKIILILLACLLFLIFQK